MNVKAALFDLDGTLLDSMGVWNDVDERFLKLRGLAVPPDYQHTIATMRMHDAAAYTIKRFALDETPESLMAEWLDMVRQEYAHTISLKPHAREFLYDLAGRGIKLGTASSLVPELFVPALKNNGIYDLFEAFTSAAEAPRGKEYPDIYLLAAQKLGVAPQECAFYDDMPAAITGAKKAGMYTVGVYDARANDYEDTMRAAADRFIYDFSLEINEYKK